MLNLVRLVKFSSKITTVFSELKENIRRQLTFDVEVLRESNVHADLGARNIGAFDGTLKRVGPEDHVVSAQTDAVQH